MADVIISALYSQLLVKSSYSLGKGLAYFETNSAFVSLQPQFPHSVRGIQSVDSLISFLIDSVIEYAWCVHRHHSSLQTLSLFPVHHLHTFALPSYFVCRWMPLPFSSASPKLNSTYRALGACWKDRGGNMVNREQIVYEEIMTNALYLPS